MSSSMTLPDGFWTMKFAFKISDGANCEYLRELYSNVVAGAVEGRHGHVGDSGFDLFCPVDVVVPSRNKALINFGISAEAFRFDGSNTSYNLQPRSSICKTAPPLLMPNSIGLIDAGYRGEIMAYVYNPSDEEYTVERGTRLFQIVNPLGGAIIPAIVDELSETARGSGGFGSTGIKG